MERIALGFLALSAVQFDAMTPRELQWRYDAEIARENRRFERLAQLACWVINPWLGRGAEPITVRRLLRSNVKRPKQKDWWDED